MKMCNGCVYNLNTEKDPNSVDFDRFGCGQSVCVHEARIFDFDSNYKPKRANNKNGDNNK